MIDFEGGNPGLNFDFDRNQGLDFDFIWVSPSAPISGGRPTIADSHLHWQMQLQTYASYFADAVEPRRLGTVALSHVLRSDTRTRLHANLHDPTRDPSFGVF